MTAYLVLRTTPSAIRRSPRIGLSTVGGDVWKTVDAACEADAGRTAAAHHTSFHAEMGLRVDTDCCDWVHALSTIVKGKGKFLQARRHAVLGSIGYRMDQRGHKRRMRSQQSECTNTSSVIRRLKRTGAHAQGGRGRHT